MLERFHISCKPPPPRCSVAKVTGDCVFDILGFELLRVGQTRPFFQWRARAPVCKLGPNRDRLLSLMARLAVTSFERLRIAVWFLPVRSAT